MVGIVEMVEMRLEVSLPKRSHLRIRGYQIASYPSVFKPFARDGGTSTLNDLAHCSAEDSNTTILINHFLETMPTKDRRGLPTRPICASSDVSTSALVWRFQRRRIGEHGSPQTCFQHQPYSALIGGLPRLQTNDLSRVAEAPQAGHVIRSTDRADLTLSKPINNLAIPFENPYWSEVPLQVHRD